VEQDSVAQLECTVDSKPSVSSVKWTRNGRFIDTHFKHTIPRVSVEDKGEYICAADNGLGKTVTAELVLDVLHAPTVTLPESVEARHGDEFTLECQVSANPPAASVSWTKQGDASFSQSGSTLRLANIEAAHNGVYTCSATNYVQPTGGERSVRTANASVSVNVRHAPGVASVLPEKPTAVDGKSVTLTCKADPPGYPKPTFSWWREDGSPMASGEELTIEQVKWKILFTVKFCFASFSA
jgi:echinoid protein